MIAEISPWIVNIALPLGAIGVGLLAHTLVSAVLGRLVSRTRASAFKAAIEVAYLPSRIAIVLFAVLTILPVADFPAAWEAVAARVLAIGLIAALGWGLTRMVGAAFDVAIVGAGRTGESDVQARRLRTQLSLSRQVALLTIWLVTAGLILTAIPVARNIGLSLFASAGVAGIVLGIAARPLIANLIAGLQIAITQPIRIGDAVIVEGEFGTIEEISSAYVVIAVWDQRRLIVPLSYFLERPFQNWALNSSALIQPIYIQLDYSVPVDMLRNELHAILRSTPLWDGRVWNPQVSDLKERTMELRALVSAANAGQAWDL